MKAGPGRPKGSQNKTTAALKEAILRAGELVGHDGKGKAGLTGYCRRLAEQQPQAFATLLGKVLPMTANMTHEGKIEFYSGVPRNDDD